MSTTVYEGLWDCSDCGNPGIPGHEKECPRCHNPQDSVLTPEEDWYLPGNARVVSDAAELDQFDDGPSWNCGKCQTLNNGDQKVCSRCGEALGFNDTVTREVIYDDRVAHDAKPDTLAERLESSIDRAERALATKAEGPRKMKDLTLPEKELPRKGRDTDFYDKIRDDVNDAAEERERISQLSPVMRLWETHRKAILIGAAIVAVLVVIGIVMSIVHTVHKYTATVPGTVTVSELHWLRNVEVEEYTTLTDGDWSYPGDARVQGSENRIRTYRTVHDGWHTESYTDYETRYKSETYTDMEARYRTETSSGTCTRMVSGGNGSFRSETYSCLQTRTVTDYVPVQKTRQVSYQVPVQKTRQVEDTHQEPVWDTWYTYQVDRWITDRWVTASDTTSAKVIWPEVTDLSLDSQPGDQVGEERVGNERNETYDVVYTDSQAKQHSDKKGYDLWSKLEKGETISATYLQHNGELKSVDWDSALKPAA